MNGDHSNRRTRRIVIVGGGSAGAMAAAYLRRALPVEMTITMIESPHVAPIGVGEGTIPAVRDLVRFIGLDDDDLIEHADATFKLGVRFDDWYERGEWWWHPFFCRHPQFAEEAIVDAYATTKRAAGSVAQAWSDTSLADVSMSWQLADNRRCPRFIRSHGDYEGWHPDYAYHFDAALFAKLLKERVARAGGVRHIVDHVTEVTMRAGSIHSISTENSGRIEGDFFVDCTGLRRLLMGAFSNIDFVSYGDELPCDRAVALSVPHGHRHDDAGIRPYTTSTALSSGWAWQIDLASRTGFGYVYSSRHQTEDQADAELRRFVGNRRAAGIDSSHLRFEAGHLARPFVGNCVALGLAEGFVEPLEATSLGVTAQHVKNVARLLIEDGWRDESAVTEEYNASVAAEYDEIKAFLVAHYCLSRRRDSPFWREVTQISSPLHSVHHEPIAPPGSQPFARQSWICLADGFDALAGAAESRVAPSQPTVVLDANQLALARASQQRVLPGFAEQTDYIDHVTTTSARRAKPVCPFIRTESTTATLLDQKLALMDLSAAEAALLAAALRTPVGAATTSDDAGADKR